MFDGTKDEQLDFAIVNPLAPSYTRHATTVDMLEWYARVHKDEHYHAINPNIPPPTPIIFDVYGFAGKRAADFLDRVKKHAKANGKRFSTNWWNARLSVCIQRGNYAIVQSYNTKCFKSKHGRSD